MRGGFSKKGQETMGLPFGMMFALFLIVVFIVIAFIAVKSFLDIGDCAQVGTFYDDLQKAVNGALNGQYSQSDFKIRLSSGIEKVCFTNLSIGGVAHTPEWEMIKYYDIYNVNTFLIPPEKGCNMEYKLISGINISKTTDNSNPYCVENGDTLKINKGFYDKLVWLS